MVKVKTEDDFNYFYNKLNQKKTKHKNKMFIV